MGKKTPRFFVHNWRNVPFLKFPLVSKVLESVYYLYEKALMQQVMHGVKPTHLAVILDGNRRYARFLGLESWMGHKYGAEKVKEFLEWCWEVGIKMVTLYAFSTENFNRPQKEVEEIMKLAEEKFHEVIENWKIHKYKVRIKAIGRLDMLPESVRNAIRRAEEATKDYDRYFLNVAIGYGGRAEIVDAVRKIAQKVANGKLRIDDIDERVIEEHLYTVGMPDPDLIIRTSGEERLSGFLLWQSAYSELYFCGVYWPEIRKIDLLRAVRDYQNRERRFGR
ncbi:MAG: di-trans,poly-cis-decaprenylcistransferase [Candidatus Freyarchaeota archaeon]|nr:di-trans,poly-cis-decaprenylcistransferase [Candidatus Jordarchaeia archaeon]